MQHSGQTAEQKEPAPAASSLTAALYVSTHLSADEI